METERSRCTKLSLGYFIFISVLSVVFVILPIVFADWYKVHLSTQDRAALYTMFSVYLVSLPVAYFPVLRKIPVSAPPKQKFGFWRGVVVFLCTYFLSIAANFITIIGSVAVSFIGGKPGFNSAILNTMTQKETLIMTLYAVLIGPIMEELVFRKLLIDRLYRYGEAPAILISALAFGLFHMRTEQILYAFAFGLGLAYLYCKSGRIRNTMICHITLNSIGTILAHIMQKYSPNLGSINLSDMSSTLTTLKNMVPVLITDGIIYTMIFAGLVLFFIFVWRIKLKPGEVQLPKGTRFKTLLLNVYAILYLVVTLGIAVYRYIQQYFV